MKDLAIKAIKEAGEILLEHFGKGHKVEFKTRMDYVTEADKEAERKIKKILSESGYGFIGEESGETKTDSEFKWIVDPLDGTTNYTVGNPFFGVAIALAKKDEVILGLVYCPLTKELFIAEKGKGAFLNDKEIHVSNESDISKSLLVYCHSNDDSGIRRIIDIFSKLKPLPRDFNRMRSAGLEMAFVACGRLEAYMSPGLSIWDVAPGSLLVREAGGKVTDFNNEQWTSSKTDILASNGKIHDKILEILKGL